MLATLARAILLLLVAAAPALADVVRIDVQSRSDLVGGQPFGAAGPYEKLSGKIFFAVDPALPANRIVTDLDKAPRNAAGKVEVSADRLRERPTDSRARAQRLRRDREGSGSFAGRSRASRLHRARSRIARQRADRARLGRRAAPNRAAEPVGVRARRERKGGCGCN